MPKTQRPDEAETLQGVNRVVWQALSTLAPQGNAPGEIRKTMESYLVQMTKAVLVANPAQLFEVVKDMRRARITNAQIAEGYVPTVARRLGDEWLADRIDFTAVSIGASRLQALLRRLRTDWEGLGDAQHYSAPAYIVGVPEGEQHTLGAAVLAGQLRHRGLAVHLDFELTVETLAEQVRNQNYSGFLISTSSAEHLEHARKLVECAKNESREMPVIIGGILLDHASNIRQETLADLVTSNVYDALRHCDVSRAALDALPPYPDQTVASHLMTAPRRRAAE